MNRDKAISTVRFCTEYPDIEVEIIKIPDPAIDPALHEVVRQKLWTQIMSGRGPDLFFLDSPALDFEGFFPDVEKAMRSGIFCDLLPMFTDPLTGQVLVNVDKYSDVMLEAGQLDGQQFVMPLMYNFTTVVTNDITRERLGITDISGTAETLAGLRRVFASPGAGRMAVSAGGGHITRLFKDGQPEAIFLNPYDYASRAIVDYDAGTSQIDTPLTRDILETGKFLWEHTQKLREEGWLRRSQVFSEAVTGAFEEYARSEDYVVVANQALAQWDEGPFITNFYGFLPRVDAIPSEDGGVTAQVTAFAAIRANSSNKVNAMRFLAFALPSFRTLFYDNFYHSNYNDYTLGVKPIVDLSSFTGHWRLDGLNLQSRQSMERTVELWNRVTATRFPVPKEVTDIIRQYYDSEIGLDDAIERMQNHWNISLDE
ncbi:MAG: hypothetical protein LBJ84_05755 [Oscillospiraceae bacterium]|nr:hypothetical protein [Oscillospiraceae bacterium]